MANPPTDGVRVALDATALLGRPTGVGTVVRGLLAGLGARPDVAPVAYGVTGTGWRHLPGVLPPGVAAARPVPLPAAVLHRLWSATDHPGLGVVTGPVAVVHGTNYVVPRAGRAVRLVSVHDLTAVRYPELCSPASLRYPDLVRRAVASGAEVHTAAHSVADEIEEHFGVPAERIHVLGWGLDEVTEDPARGGGHAGERGRPYVLGLGTVEPRKAFPGLVRAFAAVAAAVPDVELRIAGPAGWGEHELAEAIRTSPVRDRIRRLGWVDDVEALVAGAAVFAYPSVYEGYGLPPLEAMARGVPVVATATGAIPEVVGDAARLVPPRDLDALAAGLVEVLEDGGTRAELVTAGRARVAGMTWARAAEGYAGLYRTLAGR